MESLSIEKILNDKNVSVTCDDWPLVYDLLAKDKGMIAFTGHYGNWELLAGYVALQKNLALSVIGRPARNGDLQKEIARIRQRYGVKTIWRDGSLLAREIIGDLKAGKIIAALIDQDTQVQSVPVPFFGEMAQTPVSLASLALRHDTPVVAAFLGRLSNCQFDVKIYELTERESALKLLIQYNTYLEKEIRKDPSQWVWFHKRWRTTPTGYRRSYKEYIKWLNEKYCSQNS
jgi:KDO2-lipid IV(A) lauroyltransferase